MTNKLKVRVILEILGRPKEHVFESLKMLIEKMAKEPGIHITEKTINEPIPVEKTDDLFTTFAEVYADLDSMDNYMGLIFAYMPAHIELIHPEKLEVTNGDFNALGNRIIMRLHDYDSITKRVIADRDMIANKLREVAPHLFTKEDSAELQEKLPKKSAKAKVKRKKKKN
jgi:hypothetical protein